MSIREHTTVIATVCGLFVAVLCTSGHAAPWVPYADTVSDSVCDVVNAANLELVVLEASGEFVGITGTDVVFLDTFVDEDGTVFYEGQLAGFIDFAEDGDGFRTLWWFTLLGDVANVNEFTGEPTPTGLVPEDFVDVPCDACPLWDEPAECLDTDLDGVEDAFDFCPLTPFDELADVDGCSCSQIDGDGDGVDACDDVCPDTPLTELADFFGCSCSQLDDDQDGVDDCLDLCPTTPPDLIADVDGCACEEIDGDLDGINVCFDLCPGTPVNEFADLDGCSCSQLDDDQDGVDDCDDLCPGTSPVASVDIDGCAIRGPTGGGTVVSVCGSVSATIFVVMLCGLVGLRRTST